MLGLAACFPQIDARGHVEAADIAEQVKAGETTKEDVMRIAGSPSSRSNFGPESWYYISAHKERNAFLAPKTLDQEITRIEFDPSGIASKVERYSLKDGKQIAVVERATPTEGHRIGVMEQLLGNLGRFNKPRSKMPNPTRPY